MPPLHKRRRDLNFDCILHPALGCDDFIDWQPPSIKCGFKYGPTTDSNEIADKSARIFAHKQYLQEFLDIFTVEDNRTTEIVLIHKPSGVLVLSDLLYKSSSRGDLTGPGGDGHRYCFPKWFAQGQEDLFYKLKSDNSNGLLPAYRTHPSYRKIDLIGCSKSLKRILKGVAARKVQTCVTCHTDPIYGHQMILDTIGSAWEFLL